MPIPISVYNVDRTQNQAELIIEMAKLILAIGKY